MPRKRVGPKKIKDLKFPPEGRICHNTGCMKSFTAKRAKQRFCSPRCRQAVFSFEKEKKSISHATKEIVDEIATLKSKLVRRCPESVFKDFVNTAYRLTLAIGESAQELGAGNGLWEALKIAGSLHNTMLQFVADPTEDHCTRCGGTISDPELIWRGDYRCTNDFHAAVRPILDGNKLPPRCKGCNEVLSQGHAEIFHPATGDRYHLRCEHLIHKQKSITDCHHDISAYISTEKGWFCKECNQVILLP